MRPTLLILAAITALTVPADATAQAVGATVRMSADRDHLEAGETFNLMIEAEVHGATGGVQIDLPELGAFDVIRRSPVRTPLAFSFGMGGAQPQVRSTSRQVVTLRTRSVGVIELAPASVRVGGRRFESNPLTLTVGGAPGDPTGGGLPPASQVDGMVYDPNGFVRTWVDDGEPFVGEQVTVTVYLYLPRPLRGAPAVTQEPTAEGMWVQSLLPPSHRLEGRTQDMNGRRFQVYILRRFAAFPLQAGELTIGATSITLNDAGIWDVLGRPREPFARTGPPVTFQARELPADGRPTGDPHVGMLSLSAQLDRSQVATGDAVTLTVTANGRGAMEQIQLPTPQVDGLRILAPEIHDAFAPHDGVLGGERTVRWLIVPERGGSYPLGPFEIPVFDPTTERWSVARATAITLTAAGNPLTEERPESEEVVAEPERPSASAAFGPVHTVSALRRTHGSFSSQGWFLGLLAIGPLAFLLALGGRALRRRALSPDPRGAPKRARKAAQKRLAAAREYARDEEPRPFYAAVAKALGDVLEAKLGRAIGSLTHPELRRALGERGMAAELSDKLVDELEGCDYARFSAVGVSREEMESCLGRARELLESLDRFRPTEEEAS